MATSTSTSAVHVQSAKDVVTEEIRGLIYDGQLPLGERVSIDELATRFGVSRTPVRDALWQLSAEGLVTIIPRVGVSIREISAQEVADVYDIKTALEPLMASWAAQRGTAEARAEFLKSIALLEKAAKKRDLRSYVRLLEERRAALLAMAGSDALHDAFGVLDGRVRLLRFRSFSRAGRLAESVAGHRNVAEAIESGDADRAFAAMQTHMHRAAEGVRALVCESSAAS